MATSETTTTTTTIKGLEAVIRLILATIPAARRDGDLVVVPEAALAAFEVTATGKEGAPSTEFSVIDGQLVVDVRDTRRLAIRHRETGATIKVAPVKVAGRWTPFRTVVATNATNRMAKAIRSVRDASRELAEAEAKAEAARTAPLTHRPFDGLDAAIAAFEQR